LTPLTAGGAGMTSLAVGKVKTPCVPILGPKKSTVMKVMGVMKLPNSLVIIHLKGELSFKMKKLPNCWVISSIPLLTSF